MIKVKIKNNLNYNLNNKKVVSKLKKSGGSFLGFKSNKDLAEFLESEIYGHESDAPRLKAEEKKAFEIINKTLDRVRNKLDIELNFSIHIFPSFNKFINKSMNGVSGYTPDNKNILLFLAPMPGWKEKLPLIIVHELAHLIAFTYQDWRSLEDSLVFEGLAEHFREDIIGGEPAPWSVKFSANKLKKYLPAIKKILNKSDDETYPQIFLGAGNDYPLWLGYSIGYQIVKSYFKNSQNKDWIKIFKANPQSIIKTSNFFD
jgi:uncharacterized protein YjaZ